ncbi:class I SAM-dependent methyltransferase [Catenulispora pinisilvae]|uniref:class I SAM-dependent methyltransferase n=1 Tax=Catenulispora pinisilvae TaxID=2705253 RepID=UPI0018914AAD|nr:class I SAM-dependent methyltransferase [Catenulispora pinisilvae]
MKTRPNLLPDEAAIREFFDRRYEAHQRYWWGGDNRYSIEPAQHTDYHATVLQIAQRQGPGRALDLGAGEGADAIRLAKLGWEVDAIELSPVACEKIETFAREERVNVRVRNESMTTAVLTDSAFNPVLMNGSLHYVADKLAVLSKVLQASVPGAVHAVALFSTATPMPAEHTVVPVFPDDEGGIVEDFYQDHTKLRYALERDRPERSHPGFGAHHHSHIKLITEVNPAEQP